MRILRLLLVVVLGMGVARARIKMHAEAGSREAKVSKAAVAEGFGDRSILRMEEPVQLLLFGLGLFGAAGMCVYRASRSKRDSLRAA